MGKYIINGADADRERLAILSQTYDDASIKLLHRAEIKNNTKILELGCGTGLLATRISQEILGPDGKIIALDSSADRINSAKKKQHITSTTSLNFV